MVRILKWIVASCINGACACIALLTLPIYAHSEKAFERSMQIYDIQCTILRVLRMVRFEVGRSDGLLSSSELLERVSTSFQTEIDLGIYCVALKHLVYEEAVHMYRLHTVSFFKDGSYTHNKVHFFSLNNDSDYRPRKPRKKSKKEEKKLVHAPV